MEEAQGVAEGGQGAAAQPDLGTQDHQTQETPQAQNTQSQSIPYARFAEVNRERQSLTKAHEALQQEHAKIRSFMERIGQYPELVNHIKGHFAEQERLENLKAQGWQPPAQQQQMPNPALEKVSAMENQLQKMLEWQENQKFERMESEAEHFVRETGLDVNLRDPQTRQMLADIVRKTGVPNLIDAVKLASYNKLLQPVRHQNASAAMGSNANTPSQNGNMVDDATWLQLERIAERAG